MITYNWTVTQLMTETVGTEQDYVVIALYDVIGTDSIYTSEFSDMAQFSTTQVGEFIPYDELTNDIVIGWIKTTLGENGIISIESCINGQIESQINPPVVPVNTALPWS